MSSVEEKNGRKISTEITNERISKMLKQVVRIETQMEGLIGT